MYIPPKSRLQLPGIYLAYDSCPGNGKPVLLSTLFEINNAHKHIYNHAIYQSIITHTKNKKETKQINKQKNAHLV